MRHTLDKWYMSNLARIRRLRTYTLRSVNFGKIVPDMCDLFDSLRVLAQPRTEGRTRTIGATAAGKILHLTLPNLCPIWDEQWVRKPLGLEEQAWAYLTYMRVVRSVLVRVVREVAKLEGVPLHDASTLLVQLHETTAGPLSRKEPLTKFFDEAVYGPEFRDNWVRPLMERRDGLPWGP